MKKCPFCAEDIQDEAIKCRYCGSLLTGAGVPGLQSAAGADFAPEVARLLAAHEKIEAIKLVRQRTGVGLVDAKAYVDAIEAGRVPQPLPVRSTAPGTPQQPDSGGGRAFVVLLFLVAFGAVLYWWWIRSGR